jgi:hypothetical protein
MYVLARFFGTILGALFFRESTRTSDAQSTDSFAASFVHPGISQGCTIAC